MLSLSVIEAVYAIEHIASKSKTSQSKPRNEIKQYEDCRYISSIEAAWRKASIAAQALPLSSQPSMPGRGRFSSTPAAFDRVFCL